MIFESERHERKYGELLERVGADRASSQAVKATLYLIALVGHEDRLFNFEDCSIKLKGLNEPWQTGGSSRATTLAFILWNGNPGADDQRDNNIYNIFGYSEYDRYFIEALRIRYPRTTGSRGE